MNDSQFTQVLGASTPKEHRWRCTGCGEEFWIPRESLPEEADHNCKTAPAEDYLEGWSFQGLKGAEPGNGVFRCDGCGHEMSVNLADARTGRTTSVEGHTCKISGVAKVRPQTSKTIYKYAPPSGIKQGIIHAQEGHLNARVILEFKGAEAEEIERVFDALKRTKRPTPRAQCVTCDACSVRLQVQARLEAFLETNFNLHRRRLTAAATPEKYVSAMSSMTAFKDVLDFLRKS